MRVRFARSRYCRCRIFRTTPNQEYFVDGMTDELITDLAQIRELKVVSKTSIMQYKGTRTPLPQIGRELGVDAVVEGSVLRSGDRVRITAQLIRTATDRHIWAEAYDGDLKDVLSLQARVAEAITNQVKLNLTAKKAAGCDGRRAVNPEAFDLYLHGRYAWNQRNGQGFHRAIEYFQPGDRKRSRTSRWPTPGWPTATRCLRFTEKAWQHEPGGSGGREGAATRRHAGRGPHVAGRGKGAA